MPPLLLFCKNCKQNKYKSQYIAFVVNNIYFKQENYLNLYPNKVPVLLKVNKVPVILHMPIFLK